MTHYLCVVLERLHDSYIIRLSCSEDEFIAELPFAIAGNNMHVGQTFDWTVGQDLINRFRLHVTRPFSADEIAKARGWAEDTAKLLEFDSKKDG